MIAYHGKQEVKDLYLTRVRLHREADELVKGKYWEDGKGCAVGCAIHSSNHEAYETEIGVPQLLARLEDRIFEGLPNEVAMLWPERFLDAIAIGADLSMVWPKFAVWLLVDEQSGVIRFAKRQETKDSINLVSDLYRKIIDGEEVEQKTWRAAAAAPAPSAYASASASAAYAYAYAADAYASSAAAYASAYASASASAAAYAVAYAADDAVYAADAYASSAAVSHTHYVLMADKLEELLKECGEK